MFFNDYFGERDYCYRRYVHSYPGMTVNKSTYKHSAARKARSIAKRKRA
jgi:hypothetical protein